MAEKLDVPMNTFPQVTDAEYIYAEETDGSQVKIKKKDLLGLLFQGRGVVPSKDYNNCTKSGVYEIINGEEFQNGPAIPVNYGVLINFVGVTYAIQVIYEAFESRRILFRFRSEIGEWYNWFTFNHD